MTDETEQHVHDAQAAINAGLALADPYAIDADAGVYTVVVPDGGTLEKVDTEQYAQAPRRLKGTYRPATVDALSTLIVRHGDPDTTTIWVHPSSGRIVAVFNDNDGRSVQPGWRDHRAELQLQHPPEWEHWTSLDNELMTHVRFAEHIEDGLPEIRQAEDGSGPTSADMLELAQTIQAVRTANFRSAHRIDNGNIEVRYEEETDATAGKSGDLGIPTAFTLGIAPFIGEDPIEVTARFRYRLNGGRVTMGYKLDRPDHKVRWALEQIAERLRSSHQAINVIVGEPAGAA